MSVIMAVVVPCMCIDCRDSKFPGSEMEILEVSARNPHPGVILTRWLKKTPWWKKSRRLTLRIDGAGALGPGVVTDKKGILNLVARQSEQVRSVVQGILDGSIKA